jgi:hypothetical protein
MEFNKSGGVGLLEKGLMARKKKEPPKEPEPARPASKQFTIIALKGSAEYREWLMSVSKQSRIPAAVIVDVALARWAEDNGYPTPPRR